MLYLQSQNAKEPQIIIIPCKVHGFVPSDLKHSSKHKGPPAKDVTIKQIYRAVNKILETFNIKVLENVLRYQQSVL